VLQKQILLLQRRGNFQQNPYYRQSLGSLMIAGNVPVHCTDLASKVDTDAAAFGD